MKFLFRKRSHFWRYLKKTAITVMIFVITFGGFNFALPLRLSTAQAAMPQYLGYQGRLKNSSGTALTGSYDFTFKIYDALTGGNLVWSETQSSITVTSGYFSVSLGASTALDIDFSVPYWITTTVNSDTEMTPRSRINAVGYAYTTSGVETRSEPTDTNDAGGGRLYYDSDDGNLYLLDDVASAWVDLTAAAGDANTDLGNLASTEINADLLPDEDNFIDIGSVASSWANLYLDGTATMANASATNISLTDLYTTNINENGNLLTLGGNASGTDLSLTGQLWGSGDLLTFGDAISVNSYASVTGDISTLTTMYTPQICLNGSCQTSWPAGSPGGNDTYVQYNDSSAFGGDSAFTWNETSDLLSMTNASSTNLSLTDLYATNINENGTLLTIGGNASGIDLSLSGQLWGNGGLLTVGDNASGTQLSGNELWTTDINSTNASSTNLSLTDDLYVTGISNFTGLSTLGNASTTDISLTGQLWGTGGLLTIGDALSVGNYASITNDLSYGTDLWGTNATLTGFASATGDVSAADLWGTTGNFTNTNYGNASGTDVSLSGQLWGTSGLLTIGDNASGTQFSMSELWGTSNLLTIGDNASTADISIGGGANGDVFSIGTISTEGGDVAVYENTSGNKSLLFDADAAMLTASKTLVNDWTQVNSNGFGDANNKGIFDMEIFNGFLYAGTYKVTGSAEMWRTQVGSQQSDWAQVNTDGFGDANNKGIYSMIAFHGYLYAGTLNTTTGTEVWRSSDGSTWAQINTDGFGDVNNGWMMDFEIFNGYLYTVVGNVTTGMELWRTNDGAIWAQVNTDGFGSANNQGAGPMQVMTVYNNYLYVGTYSTVAAWGLEMWRSPDGTTWTEVSSNGFGDTNNKGVTGIRIFKGYLYVFVANSTTGIEAWRTQLGSQQSDWAQVNTDGFGDSNNLDGMEPAVYNDYLYIGTSNSNGTEIWRTDDGSSWFQVNTNGFGSADLESFGLEAYHGYLYVCTYTNGGTGKIWRTQTGTITNSSGAIYGQGIYSDQISLIGGRIAGVTDIFGENASFNSGGITQNFTIGGDFMVATNTLYVQSSEGRVGIATSTPDYLLDIYNGAVVISDTAISVDLANGAGDLYVADNLEVDGTASMTETTLSELWGTNNLLTINDNASGTQFSATELWGTGGLLTIGDAASGTELSLTDNLTISGRNFLNIDTAVESWPAVDSVATRIFRTAATGASYPFNAAGNLILQSRDTGALRDIILATGNPSVERLIVAGGGNIGIATTTPDYLLDVYGGMVSISDSVTRINLANGAGDLYVTNDLEVDGKASITELSVGSEFWPADIIFANDFVMTEAPDETPGLYFKSDQGDLLVNFQGNSYVGLGDVTNPNYPLEMKSGAHVTAGGVWTDASDERLKHLVEDSPYGLKEILQLEPKIFKYLINDEPDVGFIAQDVKELIPELVTGDANERMLGLKYSHLSAVLVKAIQEQQAQIDALTLANSLSGGNLQGVAADDFSDIGQLTVDKDMVFNGKITVKEQVAFNKDTVGQAEILPDDTEMRVEFDKEYEYQPIVTLTLRGENALNANFKYTVVDESNTGFTIKISEPQEEPVQFNWHAFGADEGKIFISDGNTRDIELVIDDEMNNNAGVINLVVEDGAGGGGGNQEAGINPPTGGQEFGVVVEESASDGNELIVENQAEDNGNNNELEVVEPAEEPVAEVIVAPAEESSAISESGSDGSGGTTATETGGAESGSTGESGSSESSGGEGSGSDGGGTGE